MSVTTQRFSLFKRHNGIYYIAYFHNGRRRWKSTGAKSKPEANRALTQFKDMILEGRREIVSLRAFVERFMAYSEANHADQPPEAARGREPPVEASGCGPDAGQADAPGCAVKKALRPALRRELIREMQLIYRTSERRALRVFRWPRSTHRHKSTADPQLPLRLRLRELSGVRVAYGYRRLHVLLRREGWQIKGKRVYRLYRQEGLVMRKKLPPSACRMCQAGDPPHSLDEERLLEYGLCLRSAL